LLDRWFDVVELEATTRINCRSKLDKHVRPVLASMHSPDPEVDPAQDPEGYLLELATGLDISGRQPEAFPANLREQVVSRHPRLDLGPEFIACFRDQAERKPDSSAARMVRDGIAERIVTNPLDQLP
jgi:hypothetical protein